MEIKGTNGGWGQPRAMWANQATGLSTRMDEVHCGPVDVTFGVTRFVAYGNGTSSAGTSQPDGQLIHVYIYIYLYI